MTKQDITSLLSEKKSVLKSKFGVKKIALFGSFVKDSGSEESDVDLFIEFERKVGLKIMALSDFLEQSLGRKVDILTPGGLKGIRIKRLRDEILGSLEYV